ncbi:hypothetical protein I79_009225 [Cricetulus griseus]|uniref:Uncharacterized protein n=1 Tax=Cricetulus griseus TaxID=10029 RepID=G3HF70_CRIGR|nr:hypothetical protein I79_009225 [Cricetulus griseus]
MCGRAPWELRTSSFLLRTLYFLPESIPLSSLSPCPSESPVFPAWSLSSAA